MKHYPSVTIALFNFNGIGDTRKCLNSLLRTDYPSMKVEVIDDGSARDEIKVLEREFADERVTFSRDGENRGFSARCNQVLTGAKSDYIVLLNNDTIVPPNWLKPLVEAAEKDKRVGVCQSKLLAMDNPEYFEYAGGAGGFVDLFGYPYARGRIVFHLEKDEGQYDDIREIFWSSGAAMMVRKNIIKKAGIFDTSLFAYAEEVDFCWRVKKAGFKIIVVPKSVVFHKGTGYWKKKQARKSFLIHRNHLFIILEHLSFTKLVIIFPLRIFLDYLSIVYYLLTNRLDFSLAVIRAHISLLLMVPLALQRRNHLFYKQNRQKVELDLKPVSIVFQYFVLGRKRFSEIIGEKPNVALLPEIQLITFPKSQKKKARKALGKP